MMRQFTQRTVAARVALPDPQRRPRPGSASLIAALALTLIPALVSCGGQASRPFTPGDATGAASAATPPTSGGPSADEPRFPPDVQIVFAAPLPADHGQAAVIDGFRRAQLGYYRAIVTQGKDMGFRNYVAGDPAVLFTQTLRQALAERHTVTGTLRFFATRVAAQRGDAGAAVVTCVDRSQWEAKDVRTGRAIPNTSAEKSYYRVLAGMNRGVDGVWRIVSYRTDLPPSPEAKECRP